MGQWLSHLNQIFSLIPLPNLLNPQQDLQDYTNRFFLTNSHLYFFFWSYVLNLGFLYNLLIFIYQVMFTLDQSMIHLPYISFLVLALFNLFSTILISFSVILLTLFPTFYITILNFLILSLYSCVFS